MFPTFVGITLITFSLVQLVPGDPAEVRFQNEEAPPSGDVSAGIQRFREAYLLDQAIWRQYLHYVGPFDLSTKGHPWFGGSGETPYGGLFFFDLGVELQRPHVEIRDELGKRLSVTVPLALGALFFAYLLALPLGVLSVIRQGTLFDLGAGVFVYLLYSIPAFWAGLMLQLAFGGGGLDWLPIIGLHDSEAGDFTPWQRLLDTARHFVLPLVTLSYATFAYLSRQMRSGLLDVIREDYIRTARAKGLTERVVVCKHALRGSLGPVLTLFSSILPALIGGSVIVESIFDLPGIGSYAFQGLAERDYFVVMATASLSALVTMVCILLSDVAYAWADPRVRYE